MSSVALRRAGTVAFLAICALATLAILGFYAERLRLPLPLFASDEVAYLLRALYPDELVARNPYVATASNGVHLSVIRAIYELGAPVVVGDRIANLGAYLAGLLALWWASVKRARTANVPGELGLALLLLALGFSFYRFVATDMPGGLFVGVVAAFVLVVRRWWASRPRVAAALAGALGAALVLVKPHGVAEIAALAVVAVLNAAMQGPDGGPAWRRLPLQALLFAVLFFAVGNLIQWQADDPVTRPWAFFVSPDYSAQIGAHTLPGAWRFGLLAAVAMASGSALLAGAPAAVGLADIVRRWRAAGGRFAAEGGDLAFLILLVSLLATLAMVAIYAVKVSNSPGETLRLWGRYFEFFAPMIWLAAAPSLARGVRPWTAAAAALLTFAGLAGLLASLHAGIVLFPWDSSVLTAFFQPDATRAPVYLPIPLRALSILAVLLAGVAFAARLKPAFVGLALVLVLSGLSTWLDGHWLGPMIAERAAFARDIAAIRPRLPPNGAVSFLAPDVNQTHLGFLALEARPHVVLGPPDQAPLPEMAAADAVIVAGDEQPPGGPWALGYRGERMSLYHRAPAT